MGDNMSENTSKFCFTITHTKTADDARITFTQERLLKGINVSEIIGDDYHDIMYITDNPTAKLDDIYKFIYGKPIEALYVDFDSDNFSESVRNTGPLDWTKERAYQINWNILLNTIYAFSFSEQDFYSDIWKSISKLLNVLKEFKIDEWKKIFPVKVIDAQQSIDIFWSALSKILYYKISSILNITYHNIEQIAYVKPFLDNITWDKLEIYAYDVLKKQLSDEMDEFKNKENIVLNDIYKTYHTLLDCSRKFNELIENRKVRIGCNERFSFAFEKFGNILELELKMYDFAQSAYIYAIILSSIEQRILELRIKNKYVCRFIDKKERKKEKIVKNEYYSSVDEKYKRILEKRNNLKESLIRFFVVTPFIVSVIFLILMFVGLILSSILFSFSWKVALISLATGIIVTFTLFFIENYT